MYVPVFWLMKMTRSSVEDSGLEFQGYQKTPEVNFEVFKGTQSTVEQTVDQTLIWYDRRHNQVEYQLARPGL